MNIGNLSIGVEVTTDKMNEGMQKIAAKVTKTEGVFKGFVATMQDVETYGKKIFAAFYSVIQAAGESELVIRQLSDAMKSQNIYTDTGLKLNLDYATSLSQITKYTDEEITSVMKVLTNFGLHDKQLRDVTKSTMDLATRTGSLDSAAILLGKAFQGETGRLAQVGIQIDDNIPKSQRFAEVMKQVNNNFGGTAAGEAQTYLGALQQMRNEFGELAEALGNPLLPRMTEFSKNIKQVTQDLKQELPSAIDNVISVFKRFADSEALKPFSEMFGKIRDLSAKTAIAINGDTESMSVVTKNAMTDKVLAWQEERRNAIKSSNAELEIKKEEDKRLREIMDKRIADWQEQRRKDEDYKRALEKRSLDWQRENREKALSNFKTAMESTKSAFSDAIYSMGAEGKNFGEALGSLCINLKNMVIRLIAEEIVRTYLTGILTMQNASLVFGAVVTTVMYAIRVAITAAMVPIGIIIAAVTALIALLDQLKIKLPTFDELSDKLSFDSGLPTLDELSDQLSFKLFAGGVRNFQGGMAVVGERGPELVNLPRGSNVYSNQESRAMTRGSGGNVSVVVNATVRSDEDWERVTRNKIIPSLERYMKKTYESPFA